MTTNETTEKTTETEDARRARAYEIIIDRAMAYLEGDAEKCDECGGELRADIKTSKLFYRDYLAGGSMEKKGIIRYCPACEKDAQQAQAEREKATAKYIARLTKPRIDAFHKKAIIHWLHQARGHYSVALCPLNARGIAVASQDELNALIASVEEAWRETLKQ